MSQLKARLGILDRNLKRVQRCQRSRPDVERYQRRIDKGMNSRVDDESSILFKLLQLQSAPEVDIEPFNGDPLNFNYFMAMFKEVVESKVDDPRGRLTRLIKFTIGEPSELIRHCIQHPPEVGYENAIELLTKRYGNPHIILTNRKEIRDWPQLKFNDAKGFRDFFSFLIKCQSIVIGRDWNVLDTPDTICALVSKLPGSLTDRWNRKVMIKRHKHLSEPSLEDFIDFIEQESTLINDPLFSRNALKQFTNTKEKLPDKRKSYKSLAMNTNYRSSNDIKRLCPACSAKHDLDDCKLFLSYTIEDRSKFLGRKRLCYGCYDPITDEHDAKSCPHRRKCTICKGNHPTGLHGFRFRKRSDSKDKEENKESTEEKESVKSNVTRLSKSCNSLNVGEVISLCIVPVKVSHKSTGKSVTTLAMLDNCSQASFVTTDLVKRLDVSGAETSLAIKTINGTETVKSEAIEDLIIEGISTQFENIPVMLPKVYTRRELPVDKDDIATTDKLSQWKYLEPVYPHFRIQKFDVDLLIGANCAKALEPVDVLPSQDGGPYAYRTILGWCIVGPIKSEGKNNYSIKSCHKIAVNDIGNNGIAKHHFESKNSVKETHISNMFKKLYLSDFTEARLSPRSNIEFNLEGMSIEDKTFLTIMESKAGKVGSHYELPLPFRNEDLLMPDNRNVVLRRLMHLKERFIRNPKFLAEYQRFMKNIMDKGYARKAVLSASPGKSWYIPHHAVYNEKKNKMRVVFDCGAEYHGRSLIKELIPGPDFTNHLIGVLTDLEKEP